MTFKQWQPLPDRPNLAPALRALWQVDDVLIDQSQRWYRHFLEGSGGWGGPRQFQDSLFSVHGFRVDGPDEAWFTLSARDLAPPESPVRRFQVRGTCRLCRDGASWQAGCDLCLGETQYPSGREHPIRVSHMASFASLGPAIATAEALALELEHRFAQAWTYTPTGRVLWRFDERPCSLDAIPDGFPGAVWSGEQKVGAYEPLHALRSLGIAVHDFQPEGVVLSCPTLGASLPEQAPSGVPEGGRWPSVCPPPQRFLR